MAAIRANEVTMKGNPVYLVGPKLKAGDRAPGFTAIGEGLSVVTLESSAGKARIFSVVPSLDTPVCNVQTRTFAKELEALGDKVAAYTVSLDLPFAMGRFCKDAEISTMKNLSDTHDHSFGRHYGVLIEGLPLPLLARAVFVVDPAGTITYAAIVPEIAQEPDYAPAIEALKAAAK